MFCKFINNYKLIIVLGTSIVFQSCSSEIGVTMDGRMFTSMIAGSVNCSDTSSNLVHPGSVGVPVTFADATQYGTLQSAYPTWDVDADGSIDYRDARISHEFDEEGLHKVVFCIDEDRQHCMDVWLCLASGDQTDTKDSSPKDESIKIYLESLDAEILLLKQESVEFRPKGRRLSRRIDKYKGEVDALLNDVRNLMVDVQTIQDRDDPRIQKVSSRLELLKDNLKAIRKDIDAMAQKKESKTTPDKQNEANPKDPGIASIPSTVCSQSSLSGSSSRVGQKVDNSSCECDGSASTRMISESTLKIEPKRCLKLSECRVLVSDNGTVQVRVRGPGGKPNVSESFYVNKGCSQLRFDEISQLVLNKDVEYEIEITVAGGLKIADFSACSEYPAQYMRISGKNNPLGNLVIKY